MKTLSASDILNTPDDPAEEETEAKFRRGYHDGFDELLNYWANGGTITEARKWYDEIFTWCFKTSSSEIIDPPGAPDSHRD